MSISAIDFSAIGKFDKSIKYISKFPGSEREIIYFFLYSVAVLNLIKVSRKSCKKIIKSILVNKNDPLNCTKSLFVMKAIGSICKVRR